ncbi:MBL fold metallo-hydrolase [Rubritalea spongiae]|uniref:MBL fold metallo-hydrolase n=1 Tax=Rubritalea spongiae TaxID=430797 RepID=A0ABW5E1K8_9BACT
MLEDDFNDCLAKAIRGHGGTIAHLAKAAGITESRITSCLNGTEDAGVIQSIAPHLQLNPDRLLALKSYHPKVPDVLGLTRVVSPFGHLGVNAFIVNYGATTLLFDTGTDAKKLHELAPSPTALFITHGHPDHNQAVSEFKHTKVYQPNQLHHGEQLKFGTLTLKVLDVSGHYTPARAYFIEGLTKPVCIIGDCLFAGSIGGCTGSENYTTALANIKDHLWPLPNETILCPGHGPLTSVSQEKENNPFFSPPH